MGWAVTVFVWALLADPFTNGATVTPTFVTGNTDRRCVDKKPATFLSSTSGFGYAGISGGTNERFLRVSFMFVEDPGVSGTLTSATLFPTITGVEGSNTYIDVWDYGFVSSTTLNALYHPYTPEATSARTLLFTETSPSTEASTWPLNWARDLVWEDKYLAIGITMSESDNEYNDCMSSCTTSCKIKRITMSDISLQFSYDVNECATDNGGCGSLPCSDQLGGHTCDCLTGYELVDNNCVDVNECATSNGGCGTEVCFNTAGSNSCGDFYLDATLASGSLRYSCSSCAPDYSLRAALVTTLYVGVYGSMYSCGRVVHQTYMLLTKPTRPRHVEVGTLTVDMKITYTTGTPLIVSVVLFPETLAPSASLDTRHHLQNPDVRTYDVILSNLMESNPSTGDAVTISVPLSGLTWPEDESAVIFLAVQDSKIRSCETSCTCNTRRYEVTITGVQLTGDINECYSNNGGCDALTTCTNTLGSFECSACPPGFTGTGLEGCADANECLVDNGGCDPLVECVNTASAFECGSCPTGYSGTGDTQCQDVNECEIDNGGCDKHSVCTNEPASYSCGACSFGYAGSGSGGCVDESTNPRVSVSYSNVACLGSCEAVLSVVSFQSTLGSVQVGVPGSTTCSQTDDEVYLFVLNPFTAPSTEVWEAYLEATIAAKVGSPVVDVRSLGTAATTGLEAPDYFVSGTSTSEVIHASAFNSSHVTGQVVTVDLTAELRALLWAVGEYLVLTLALSTTHPATAAIVEACKTTCADGCDTSYFELEDYKLRIWSDENECSSGNGGCDLLTLCTNTEGNRTCGACPTGYVGNGYMGCVDINECTALNGGCDSLTLCTNYVGSYSCGDCPSGYTGHGSGTCVNINECATSNGGCDVLTECTDTQGSRTCGICPDGYTGTGDPACQDVNECATSNGGCSLSCFNYIGDYSCSCCSTFSYTGCYTASSLGSNLIGPYSDASMTPQTCQLYCATLLQDPCLDNAQRSLASNVVTCSVGTSAADCSLAPSWATCALDSGEYVYSFTIVGRYFGVMRGADCYCTPTTTSVSSLTAVANSNCRTECGGLAGVTCGDTSAASVFDINECSYGNGGCDVLTTCTNSAGGRSCGSCPTGYSGTGATGCQDINECATNNGACHSLATCTNTVASFTCGSCPVGYSGNGYIGCTNINECSTNNGGCHSLTSCTDTVGSFTCGACPSGYSGSGSTGCTDVNECATANGNCDHLATCTNVDASYSCGSCPSGYTGHGSTSCNNINECATINGGCDTLTTCYDSPGTYSCEPCPSGYGGGDTPVIVVDNTASVVSLVGKWDSLSTASAYGGTYYRSNTNLGNPGIANVVTFAPAIVSAGSYKVSLYYPTTTYSDKAVPVTITHAGGSATYQVDMSANRGQFNLLDQLSLNNDGSTRIAISTSGTTMFVLADAVKLEFQGYASCYDINECATSNGGCHILTVCTNSPGGFSCGNCPSGYSGNATTGCNDINECASTNGGCHALVECTNTPASYYCGGCPTGYAGDGYECFDINECATSNGACDLLSECTNTGGSFSCGACPSGYEGSGNTTCANINECATDNGGCGGLRTCTDTNGGFACSSCPTGYNDTGGCEDINECATDHGGCDSLTSCTNSDGSFSCGSCPTGYSGSGLGGCRDINECATNNGGCDYLTLCTNLPSNFSCGGCPEGYTGSGYTGCIAVVLIGCFQDDPANRVVSFGPYANGNMSVETCDAYCASLAVGCPVGECDKDDSGACVSYNDGFHCAAESCAVVPSWAHCWTWNGTSYYNFIAGGQFFGLQGGNECYCADRDDYYGAIGEVDGALCDTPCEGNAGFTCGGTAVNSVFDINECRSGNGGCDALTKCINHLGGFSCTTCPDGYVGDGLSGCEESTFEYEVRPLHNHELQNGWTVRESANLVNGQYVKSYDKTNLWPSYWKDSMFVYIQGALTAPVNNDSDIFVLDEGYRPLQPHAFLCTTAPDDTAIVSTLIVRVFENGTVRAEFPAGVAASSVSLKGRFAYNGSEASWTSLETAMSSGVSAEVAPAYFRDQVTGWLHVRGTLRLDAPCVASECEVATGVVVPTNVFSHDAYFAQPLERDGSAKYLRFTPGGALYVNGVPGSNATTVFLDGIALMEENMATAVVDNDGRTLYNDNDYMDDSNVRLFGLGLSSPWWSNTTSPARFLKTGGTKALVVAETAYSPRSEVLQFAGQLEPSQYLFNATLVTTLDREHWPEFHEKHMVPCKISPRLFTCAVYVQKNGEVYVLHERPSHFDPDASGHWVSLEGVYFGGYVWRTRVALFGDSTFLSLAGAATISLGP